MYSGARVRNADAKPTPRVKRFEEHWTSQCERLGWMAGRARLGLQLPPPLDLEIPVDDGRRHRLRFDVEHRNAGLPHALERLVTG